MYFRKKAIVVVYMSGLIHSNIVKILCVGFIVIVYVTGISLYYNSVRFCHENVMRI